MLGQTCLRITQGLKNTLPTREGMPYCLIAYLQSCKVLHVHLQHLAHCKVFVWVTREDEQSTRIEFFRCAAKAAQYLLNNAQRVKKVAGSMLRRARAQRNLVAMISGGSKLLKIGTRAGTHCNGCSSKGRCIWGLVLLLDCRPLMPWLHLCHARCRWCTSCNAEDPLRLMLPTVRLPSGVPNMLHRTTSHACAHADYICVVCKEIEQGNRPGRCYIMDC